MKLYHEVATIKDGNARVGYIMKPGSISAPGKYYIASSQQFNKTVREGKVQYFEWNSETNAPYVSYTAEELEEQRAMGVLAPLKGKAYWENDVVIRKRYIDALEQGAILVIPLEMLSMPLVGGTVACVIFGKGSLIEQFYKGFFYQYMSNSIFKSSVKFAGNNITASIPIYDLSSDTFIIKARSFYKNVLIEPYNLEKVKDIQQTVLKGITASKTEKDNLVFHLRKYSLER